MHIRMSFLIIKTVNLAVITAVALAPGGLQARGCVVVRNKYNNFKILGTYYILKDGKLY